MVHLILSSSKGNQGVRYFPYSGYLGLTPVRVEGVVRTKLDSDLKFLPAKSITISVRCYESRVGRVSILHSNVLVDYTQVLWSKPDGQDFGEIGDLEFPFRISVPAKVAGFSTTTFVEYRCMWRVEAIIDHAPITGVGSRQIKSFELPLIRHDIPPHPKSVPPSAPLLNYETTKPRAPRIRYSIDSPTSPIGPQDLVSIPVHLLPIDSAVSFRSASVIIERRIQLNESTVPCPPMSPASLPTPPSYASSSLPSTSSSLLSFSPTSSYQEPSNAILSSSSLSSSTITPTPSLMSPSVTSFATEVRPLLPHAPDISPSVIPSEVLSSKLVVTSIAGAESSGHFARDDSGVWSKTLTLQWPAAKSNSRWAIGETIQSDLASVKFFARVKIVVSSPYSTESIDLSEQELLIVSTNEAERQLATSKYNQFLSSLPDNTSRSKSKSPRHSRRERDNLPPLPRSAGAPPLPSSAARAEHSHKAASASVQYPGGKPTRPKSSSRRPHTSAGPRDKALNFAGVRAEGVFSRLRDPQKEDLGREQEDQEERRRRSRVDARVKQDTVTSITDEEEKGARPLQRYFVVPRISPAASGSSTSTTASTSSVSSSAESQSDEVREWEEELARIEVQSRRLSDMLGFACKRKRVAG